MRKFARVSKEQFELDEDIEFKMPKRSDALSAGYDIFLNIDEEIVIEPGQISKAIPTGFKIYMEPDEVCLFVVRSGHGFKYSIRLVNTLGVIDSSYVDNKDNEGHCFLKFHNQGNQTVTFKPGNAICQAIFMKYLVTDDDVYKNGIESDPGRKGGFGSSGN